MKALVALLSVFAGGALGVKVTEEVAVKGTASTRLERRLGETLSGISPALVGVIGQLVSSEVGAAMDRLEASCRPKTNAELSMIKSDLAKTKDELAKIKAEAAKTKAEATKTKAEATTTKASEPPLTKVCISAPAKKPAAEQFAAHLTTIKGMQAHFRASHGILLSATCGPAKRLLARIREHIKADNNLYEGVQYKNVIPAKIYSKSDFPWKSFYTYKRQGTEEEYRVWPCAPGFSVSPITLVSGVPDTTKRYMTVAYARMVDVYNTLAKEKFSQPVSAKLTLKNICSSTGHKNCAVINSEHTNVSLVPVQGTTVTNWENFPETPDCKLACYTDGYSDFGVTVCYKACIERVDMIKENLQDHEAENLLKSLGTSMDSLHWAKVGWPNHKEYRTLVTVENLVAKEIRCITPTPNFKKVINGQDMHCTVRRTCTPVEASVTHYLSSKDWQWTKFPKEGITHKFTLVRTSADASVRLGCMN